MRKAFVVGLLGFGVLAGCSDPSATMQIVNKSGPEETTTLVGVMEIGMVGPGKPGFKFDLSNGELTCISDRQPANWQRGWSRNRVRQIVDFQCDDGRSGKIQMALSGTSNEDWSGVGQGKLDDGSKVRLLVGDMSGAINWD